MDFLKKRAESFHRIALGLIDEKEYALAAVNIGQAMQFELKYFLSVKAGDFPRNHSIKRLVQDCVRFCQEINEFYGERINVLAEIENAYIMSRYYPTEYEELEVKNMDKAHLELKMVLTKCLQLIFL